MESCLYEGRVVHRRLADVRHAFRVPLFMAYLDLAELPWVFQGRWLGSARRPAPLRFRREDHLGDPALPLDACVRDLVEARLGRRPRGPIRLLTHLRSFGFVFNPVSFYWCFGSDGRSLEAIVADVTNTPWNERHAYVLEPDPNAPPGATLRFHTPKAFHVSPFLGMQLDYAWSVRPPGRQLGVQIEAIDRATRKPAFAAALSLERRAITGASLARALVRYPLMTSQVIGKIYWQALRLWRAGAPYHPHPGSRPGVEMETAA